jgi:hypothetical protein
LLANQPSSSTPPKFHTSLHQIDDVLRPILPSPYKKFAANDPYLKDNKSYQGASLWNYLCIVYYIWI